MDEEFKLEPKDIWNAVILIAVGIILVMSYIIVSEFVGAKQGCNDLGGEFKYSFPDYYCDTIPIYKYEDGWDYSREINLSNIIFP